MRKTKDDGAGEGTPGYAAKAQWRDEAKPKAGRVPRLRFPEFFVSGDWSYFHGDFLFEPIVNKDHNSDLPILAISQEFGAIPREMIDYQVSVTESSIENYKVVDVGDFIISLRSFQGGIEYSYYKGICSPAYIVLRKSTNEIEDHFYRFFFKTDVFIAALNKNLEGIRDGKMVSYAQFSELKLPFPHIKEQQKIVACLSSLDELISAHTRKLEALKKYKKGLMQQLFPAGEETVARLRFPEFWDEGEWITASIEDIADISSGGTPDRSKNEYWGGSIEWITTSLVDFNTITCVEEYITELGLLNSSAKIFKKDTIIMAMYGQGVNRGKVALLGIEAATNQACAAIITRGDVDPIYLFFFFSSRYEKIRKISNSGGQENLSAGLIKKIPITYPKDLPEQRKIASALSSLDELITAQAAVLEELKEHKRGLMQGLFPAPEEEP